MPGDDALLLDMKLAGEGAIGFVAGLDLSGFVASRLHQNAVIRSLEAIGEAAGKVPGTFRDSHPEIPWRDVTATRHRLIHGYADVRLVVVWEVVRDRLPGLLVALRPLVPPE
jgi:uncharacterized protein with HEPN domain